MINLEMSLTTKMGQANSMS